MKPELRLFHAFWQASTELVEGEKSCQAQAAAIEGCLERTARLRRTIDHLPDDLRQDAELQVAELEIGLDDEQARLAESEAVLATVREKRERLRAKVWDLARPSVLGDLARMG